jgi:hypothetical protein
LAGVAATTGLGVGGPTIPAGAQEGAPTSTANCVVHDDHVDISVRSTGLPPNDRLHFFVTAKDENGSITLNGVDFFTDSSGAGGTPAGLPQELPSKIGWVVFRDRNGNNDWEVDVDENLYRGDGTVTTCPSSVTLSPK